MKPLREGRKDLADRYAEKLLYDEKLTTWVIDESVAREAAVLRAKYGIRTPDAIQLATALVGGAELFITNDADLKRVEEMEVLVLEEFL